MVPPIPVMMFCCKSNTTRKRRRQVLEQRTDQLNVAGLELSVSLVANLQRGNLRKEVPIVRRRFLSRITSLGLWGASLGAGRVNACRTHGVAVRLHLTNCRIRQVKGLRLRRGGRPERLLTKRFEKKREEIRNEFHVVLGSQIGAITSRSTRE